jgi:hypothetical protein
MDQRPFDVDSQSSRLSQTLSTRCVAFSYHWFVTISAVHVPDVHIRRKRVCRFAHDIGAACLCELTERPHVGLQGMKPQLSAHACSLLLKGRHTHAFTAKCQAMPGSGQSGTQRVAEYGSSPTYPTTLAVLEHCRAFLSFLPLPFEGD